MLIALAIYSGLVTCLAWFYRTQWQEAERGIDTLCRGIDLMADDLRFAREEDDEAA